MLLFLRYELYNLYLTDDKFRVCLLNTKENYSFFMRPWFPLFRNIIIINELFSVKFVSKTNKTRVFRNTLSVGFHEGSRMFGKVSSKYEGKMCREETK